jgi:hypothetical protein
MKPVKNIFKHAWLLEAAKGLALVPALAILGRPCLAQDIEPRRWSHLPLGANFGGVAYAYTEGDIIFNPVQRIEDGEFELNTAAFKYIHAFEIIEKTARIDLVQIYQSGSWSSLLNRVPAERKGGHTPSRRGESLLAQHRGSFHSSARRRRVAAARHRETEIILYAIEGID